MTEPAPAEHTPESFEESPIELLEEDETIPPRPEEFLADLERAEPDPH